MVPVYVKGGMWTNVEDEILKAAISKYGLNQWSRVSSLLTRKNAKQCKLRWQEWLDPRIRKSDWSPEEDKRLLNLAKLRPNQWSSISLLLNRTANQCIERYQELLLDYTNISDNKSKNDLLLIGNTETSGLNKLSSGNSLGSLNLNPETKPAREDLDEMDEDEKEMISEAKARLANTQGKKAKRKAREKILSESRRIADLLRRRELKQVGINADLKLKKKFKDQMDYNADIAFELRPEEGKFDIDNEIILNLKDKKLFDKNAKIKGTFNQEVKIQKVKEKRRREQNKKLMESRTKLTKNEEEEDDNDDFNEKFANEFSKRRKLTFTDGENNDNFDNIIGNTVTEIVETKKNKSILFLSRKRHVDELDNENETEESIAKNKIFEKNERKRKKIEKKRVSELLKSLPEAVDDFEIDFESLENDTNDINKSQEFNSTSKNKLPQIVIDKTEVKRIERKKLKELQEQLTNFYIPQAVKSGLPIPYIPSNLKIENEIDNAMIDLIRNNNINTNIINNNDNNIEELENTLEIWTDVENKIEEEFKELIKTRKYDLINKSSNSIKYNKTSLLDMIKMYTKKSQELEKQLNERYNEKRQELKFNSNIQKINEIKGEIKDIEDELWVYREFEKMESESIKLRKERIQNELEEVNEIIEKKRLELFSK